MLGVSVLSDGIPCQSCASRTFAAIWNREFRRRCVSRVCPLSSMHGSLTSSETGSLTAYAIAFERHHLPAGEASMRPKCGNYLAMTFCAHQRGSGDHPSKRCHETWNVQVPGTFREVGSHATGPSPAIRRCFGVRQLTVYAPRQELLQGSMRKQVVRFPAGSSPREALANLELC